MHNVPRWGIDTHQAEFKSQLFGTTPLACFADRYTPHGGDESTVRRARASPIERCSWQSR